MPSFDPSMGRVNAVAFDPADANRFYVGAASGGVWRTTDGGVTYAPVTDQVPVLAVSSLVVDYSVPTTIYVATGDGDHFDGPSIGVWKSMDEGTNWNATGLVFPAVDGVQTYKLIQHPTQPATLFLATSRGLYTTTNGGGLWNRSLAPYVLYDLEFQPGTPSVMYASARTGSDGGVFLRSVDGGASWTPVTSGLPPASGTGRCAIAITPAAPGRVYFLSSGSSSYYGLWRSQDSGLSFTQMSGSDAANVFASVSYYTCTLTAAPDAADEVYVAGTVPYKSLDGGVTWTDIRDDSANAMACHVDFHAMEWRGTALFVGTDGGLHRSSNRGVNWTDLSARLGIAQIYAFGQAASTPNVIYTGQQDNGLNLWNGSVWSHEEIGDWGGSVIHPTRSETVYAFKKSSLYKTTDGWQSSQTLTISATESGPFVNTALVMSPVNPETLYAGLRNVWKTTNGGTTWTPLSNFASGVIQLIAVAPTDASTIYATTGTDDVWVTQNGGTNWVNTRSTLPAFGRSLRRLCVSPTAPGTAYVTTDGYGSGPRVYRTTSAGGTWQDYSGSLPVVPVGGIVAADGPLAGVYAGTANGVYYRNSAMADWIPFKAGLPNADITDLQIHRGSLKLRASTYGRGLWESSIVESAPIVTTGIVTSFGPAVAEGADNLNNVTSSTSPGYNVIDTVVFDGAPASFHLAHAAQSTQSLTLNAAYFPGPTSMFLFKSRLALATINQTLRAQISMDDAASWTDVYTQNGTGGSGESSFTLHTVSLAAYVNSKMRIRFAYTPGGSYYPQTSQGIGCYIDTISFVNTSQVVPSNPAATIINGTVNPNGETTTAWFEYGTSTAYGAQTTVQNMGSATANAPLTATLYSLLPGKIYHYRVVASNADGTSEGQDFTFQTSTSITTLLPLGRSGGRFQLQINGPSGGSYTLERSPDLQTWTSVGTVLIPAAGVLTYEDTNATSPHLFYRLR